MTDETTETAAEIAKRAVNKLVEFSMIDSDTPGAVSEEEKRFCCEQIEPIIAEAIDVAVARERDRAAVFENAYRELMDKHEQISRELEARQVEVATAEARLAELQWSWERQREIINEEIVEHHRLQAELATAEAKGREAERAALAEVLIPFEGFWMAMHDSKWIAPEVREQILKGLEIGRAAIPARTGRENGK